MAKADAHQLVRFLKPFPEEIRQMTLWLRDFIWDLYPEANELIYDNYNALAVGWSPTDRIGHIFCSIAIGRTSHNIHYGFYWGAELTDPEGLLLGEGNQYRYILVKDIRKFPKSYTKKLTREAFANSLDKVKDKSQLQSGFTILKSISAKKRTTKRKLSEKKKTKENSGKAMKKK